MLLQVKKMECMTVRTLPEVKHIAPPFNSEDREIKVQDTNIADEEITLPGRISGSSQDVIVLLILIQYLYIGSSFVRESGMMNCFLTHSVNEELVEMKESCVFSVKCKSTIQ